MKTLRYPPAPVLALPTRQAQLLASIAEHLHGGLNWAGTPAAPREALVQKGLIENLTPDGKHRQHSRYRMTDLGWQVICGAAFDKGLAIGYAGACAELAEEEAEVQRLAEKELQARWDTNEHAVAGVRKELFKKVCRVA